MGTTEKLYSEEPKLTSCEVSVLEIREVKGQKCALLDRTICYPEGGGPAGDRGWLGNVRVLDTQITSEGEILHYLEKGSSLQAGKKLTLRLDWDHRYHYMVEHTGQHLISGLLFSLFGIGTLSVHMGEHDIAIETDASAISREKIDELLEACRKAILDDVPVSSRIIPRSEIETLGLRRSVKVDSDPRIVTIEGFDEIACGGIHTERTGEIRSVLYLGSESIRGHVRLFFAFADEAEREIRENQEIISELKVLLSAPKEAVVQTVESLRTTLSDEKKRGNQLEQLLVFNTLGEIRKGEVPFTVDFSSFDFDALSHAARYIESADQILFCAVQRKAEGKIAYLIGIKGMEDPQGIYSLLKKEVLDAFGAKGGGKAPLFRGVLVSDDDESFVSRVQQVLVRSQE